VAIMAALALATVTLPASADCGRVLIFSSAAGRGVNPGVVGCAFDSSSTNWIVPGSPEAVVAWTGGRGNAPAGTLTVNGTVANLQNPRWDALRQYWTFDPVRLSPGPATLRATAYPAADPTKAETVTYQKAF
jgi:hypothetical protein